MSNQATLTPHEIADTDLDKLEHEVPICRQCELLGISKSINGLNLIRRINKIHVQIVQLKH